VGHVGEKECKWARMQIKNEPVQVRINVYATRMNANDKNKTCTSESEHIQAKMNANE